jgi:hypothetical protein
MVKQFPRHGDGPMATTGRGPRIWARSRHGAAKPGLLHSFLYPRHAESAQEPGEIPGGGSVFCWAPREVGEEPRERAPESSAQRRAVCVQRRGPPAVIGARGSPRPRKIWGRNGLREVGGDEVLGRNVEQQPNWLLHLFFSYFYSIFKSNFDSRLKFRIYLRLGFQHVYGTSLYFYLFVWF